MSYKNDDNDNENIQRWSTKWWPAMGLVGLNSVGFASWWRWQHHHHHQHHHQYQYHEWRSSSEPIITMWSNHRKHLKPGRELPEHDFAETEPKSGSRRLSRWSHSRRGKRCSLSFPELVSLAQIWFFLLISAIFLVPQEVCLQRNLARSSSCDTWPWGSNINLILLNAIVITGKHGELWGWWDVFCFPSSRNLPHSFLDKGDIFSKLGNQKLLRWSKSSQSSSSRSLPNQLSGHVGEHGVWSCSDERDNNGARIPRCFTIRQPRKPPHRPL